MNPPSVKNESDTPPSFLKYKDGRRIAYYVSEGAGPSVIFMGGFKSDMAGSKALALESFCQAHEQRFVRFDYTGHGQSSGNFRNGTIGIWLADTLDVIDQLGDDENILVGSSMGAWIMLLAALARSDKISALLGIASAPDFTEHLIWQQMNDEQKRELMENGEFSLPSCNGEDPYPITRKLIAEARKHLLLDKKLPITVPVRLVHGLMDEDVPWQTSVTLCEKLQSTDVRIKLIKDAGHRLSEPEHLNLICNTLGELLGV